MPAIKRPVRPIWADSGDRNDAPSDGALEAGWPLSNTPPTRQRFNWILNWLDGAIAYVTRRGVPDYDAAQPYQFNDRVQHAGSVWRCRLDGTQGVAPGTNIQRWERWGLLESEVAQMDADTLAAVRASGIRAANFITVVGPSILTQNNLGGTLYLGGAGNYTVTLPLASQSPPGTQIHFISGTGTAPVTIARQGSDAIFMNASGTQTQVLLALGDTLILESNGAAWYSAGGSASLAYTGGFSSLVAGTGYSQLPSGVLIQWGSAVSNAVAGERIPVTFPIAMADIAYSVTVTASVATTTPIITWTDAISATAFGLRCNTASTGVRWIAIGRR